jgi:hypothetical protein
VTPDRLSISSARPALGAAAFSDEQVLFGCVAVNDPAAMKAIGAVVLVPSESGAEGLVRPVCRGDGRGDSQDAPGFNRRSAGVLPGGRRPMPVPRRRVDDLQFGGIART